MSGTGSSCEVPDWRRKRSRGTLAATSQREKTVSPDIEGVVPQKGLDPAPGGSDPNIMADDCQADCQ